MSKWVVDIKGNYGKESFEISILRDSNEHGKRSYGWFDRDKLLVSHNGGPCRWPVTKEIWNGLVSLAHAEAARLNNKESQTTDA